MPGQPHFSRTLWGPPGPRPEPRPPGRFRSTQMAFLPLIVSELVHRLLEMVLTVGVSLLHRLAASRTAATGHLTAEAGEHREDQARNEEDRSGTEEDSHLSGAGFVEHHLRDNHPEDGHGEGQDSQGPQKRDQRGYSFPVRPEGASACSTGCNPSSRSPWTARPSC